MRIILFLSQEMITIGLMVLMFLPAWTWKWESPTTNPPTKPTLGAADCPSLSIICQCGTGNHGMNIDVRQCIRWTTDGRSHCEPCPDSAACAILPTCQQCSEATRNFADWCKNNEACRCENGGKCLHGNICLCEANFTGKYCEFGYTTTDPNFTTTPMENVQNETPTCPLPSYPLNGKAFSDTATLKFMDYVKYTCDEGYVLVGDQVRRCAENGMLTGDEPKCEKLCPIPKIDFNQVGTYIILNPDNATLMTDAFGNSIIDVIAFTCDQGWRMSGPARLRCVNGKWDKELPICRRWYGVNCPDAGFPAGTIRVPPNYSSFWAPGATFKYSCVEGDVLYGKDMLVCGYSGQWSSPPPYCQQAAVTTDTQEEDSSPTTEDQTAATELTIAATTVATTAAMITTTTAATAAATAAAMLTTTTAATAADTVAVTYMDVAHTVAITGRSSTAATMPSPMIGRVTGRACVDCCPQPPQLRHGKQQSITRPIISQTEPIYDSTDMIQDTTITYKCDNYYELKKSGSITCRPNHIWSGEEPKCKPTCGRLNEAKDGLIVGGHISQAGKWPWPVALFDKNMGSYFCSGTLLSENWLLTAAHCVETYNPSDIIAYLGKTSWDQAYKDIGYVTSRNILKIVTHDEYNKRVYDSDIALLMMSEPVEFDRDLRPACLPNDTSPITYKPGSFGIVTGWGNTDPLINKVSSELREIGIPVVDSKVCASNYKSLVNYTFISVTENMFCAGYKEGGRGVCHGDSGAGVFFNVGQNGDEMYVIEGIVSWGDEYNCVAPGLYAGFVRVCKFVSWIRDQITDVV